MASTSYTSCESESAKLDTAPDSKIFTLSSWCNFEYCRGTLAFLFLLVNVCFIFGLPFSLYPDQFCRRKTDPWGPKYKSIVTSCIRLIVTSCIPLMCALSRFNTWILRIKKVSTAGPEASIKVSSTRASSPVAFVSSSPVVFVSCVPSANLILES